MANQVESTTKQQETNRVAETTTKPSVEKRTTDFSLGIFGTSDNWAMAGAMAKQLAASSLVPKEYQNNVPNCIIALDLSNRLGTSPFLTMQNLDIIQGRPSWSAKALIGMINASGLYDFELQFDEKTDKDGKPFSCQCWTERKGRKVTGPVVDMDMAKAEGWLSKNGSKWRTMPQVMLWYRAASFFSRMNCPEISMGLYTSDEIIDGDFKEYQNEPGKQAQIDIQANANSTPFPADEQEEVVVESEVVENKDTADEAPFK